MMLGKYWDSERRRDRLKLLLKIRSQRDMLMLPCEACQVMSLVDAVKNVRGDMAELGVANGASAKMIAARAPDRILHLFELSMGFRIHPRRTVCVSRKDNTASVWRKFKST